MAAFVPGEIKTCIYSDWTPCEGEKCKGTKFMQTRTLITGNPSKCTGPYFQEAVGSYEPKAWAVFEGEGTSETANAGGACPGVPYGTLYYTMPKCPEPEIKSTKFTAGLPGGKPVGVNDGEYNIPNDGAYDDSRSGYQPPDDSKTDGYRTGNIWQDCANTDVDEDTRYNGAPGGPTDCDSPECGGKCGYNGGGRGIQGHPDGNPGEAPNGQPCAGGTNGCFGVTGDETGGDGNPSGETGADGFKDFLETVKRVCPKGADDPNAGDSNGDGGDTNGDGSEQTGYDDIPLEVMTDPNYTDKDGNTTPREGSNREGCPSDSMRNNPPPSSSAPPGENAPPPVPAPGGWSGPWPPPPPPVY